MCSGRRNNANPSLSARLGIDQLSRKRRRQPNQKIKEEKQKKEVEIS